MYLKNSQARRDLPIPAKPVTETRCAVRSSAVAWYRSFSNRNSRPRPTKGASRPSALSGPRHGGLAGQHAGSSPQLRHTDLVAERVDGGHEIERRPHRPLGVVLGRYRSAPDRHDGVPDELLHRAAVALDQCPARVEVAGE